MTVLWTTARHAMAITARYHRRLLPQANHLPQLSMRTCQPILTTLVQPVTRIVATAIPRAPFSTGTYDHVGVINNCNSCHDNVIGVGKLLNHIPTTPDNQDCADCHNTTTFVGAAFNHSGITDNCASCHDGSISIGKSIGHVQTDLIQANLDCSSCHITSTFNTFVGTFDHNPLVVDNNCASCHNTGIAMPKKLNHIPAQAECSQCHNDTSTGDFASAVIISSLCI